MNNFLNKPCIRVGCDLKYYSACFDTVFIGFRLFQIKGKAFRNKAYKNVEQIGLRIRKKDALFEKIPQSNADVFHSTMNTILPMTRF